MKKLPESAASSLTLETYLALDEKKQAIVNVLAVNGGDVSSKYISKLLDREIGQADYDDLLAKEIIESRRYYHPNTGDDKNIYRCNPIISEKVARYLACSNNFESYAKDFNKSKNASDFSAKSKEEQTLEIRTLIYLKDTSYLDRYRDLFNRTQDSYLFNSRITWTNIYELYINIFAKQFDVDWFCSFPLEIQKDSLCDVVAYLVNEWGMDKKKYDFLLERHKSLKIFPTYMPIASLLMGRLEEAQEFVDQVEPNNPWLLATQGLIALLQGRDNEAVEKFEKSANLFMRMQRGYESYLPEQFGIYQVITSLAAEQGRLVGRVRNIVDSADWLRLDKKRGLIRSAVLMEYDPINEIGNHKKLLNKGLYIDGFDFWAFLIGMLSLQKHDNSPDLFKPYLPSAILFMQWAKEMGLAWPEAEIARLIVRIDPEQHEAATIVETFRARTGWTLLADRFEHTPLWIRGIEVLNRSFSTIDRSAQKEYRVVWYVSNIKSDGSAALEAREQKRNGEGQWNKGKTVSLKTLKETSLHRPYLTTEDWRILSRFKPERGQGNDNMDQLWPALVGHPRVFLRNTNATLEVVASQPELRIIQKENGRIRMELAPRPRRNQSIHIGLVGGRILNVTEFTNEHHLIARGLGDGLNMPEVIRDQILETMGYLMPYVPVRSDIGGLSEDTTQTVDADNRLRIQLVPEEQGINVTVVVRPFGDQGGGEYPPGSGGVDLAAAIRGKHLQTHRDLDIESRHLRELIETCPSLARTFPPAAPYTWTLADLEAGLQLLLELQAVPDAVAVIEWPGGQRLTQPKRADLDQMRLKIRQVPESHRFPGHAIWVNP